MFLSANIPLYKLRQDSVKGFFQNLGHNFPSETTCRKLVNDLADKNFDSIKLKLLDEVFLLADESEIDGKSFINILAGSLNCPSETFLIVSKEIQTAPNASLMVRTIDDAVQKIGIQPLDN